MTGTCSTSVPNFSTLIDGFLDKKPAIAADSTRTTPKFWLKGNSLQFEYFHPIQKQQDKSLLYNLIEQIKQIYSYMTTHQT